MQPLLKNFFFFQIVTWAFDFPVACMKLGLAPSIEPWVVGSSTRVQKSSCRAQWAWKRSTGPGPALPGQQLCLLTSSHKSSLKKGVKGKGIKTCKNKQQFHWDMVLEVSWCLQNSRTEKIGISRLNAEFLPCSFQCACTQRVIFTFVQNTISSHRGFQPSSEEPLWLL